MTHCTPCVTRDICSHFGMCAQDWRAPVHGPIPLPVDVPDPVESIVTVPDYKPPAPINEPKEPMATQQTAEARAMWVGVIIAVLNAALFALGLTDADVTPAVDAAVLGQWGNALIALMGIAMAYFRRSLAGIFGGPS
jgi:hypothetical protein